MEIKDFSQFIGNDKAKDILQRYIEGTKARKEQAKSIIISGNYGCGKTTLAKIVAEKLTKAIDLNPFNAELKLLKAIRDDDYYITYPPHDDFYYVAHYPVSIIDEAHRIPKRKFEDLYRYFDGGHTLILCTTHRGLLPEGITSRCPIQITLEPYKTEELIQIAKNSAKSLKLDILVEEIVARTRGTPRSINNVLYLLRDYPEYHKDIPNFFSEVLGINKYGLSKEDRLYLRALLKYGQLSLKGLSNHTAIPIETIQNEIEPFLMKLGLIDILPRGRKIISLRKEFSGRKISKAYFMTYQIQSYIKNLKIPRSGKILDVGALDVNGVVRHLFPNADYLGIDMQAGKNVDLVLNAHDLDKHFPENFFDIILCLEMLEHDDNPFKTLENIRKVLKPGGLLIISTPTIGFYYHPYPKDFFRYTKDAFTDIFFKGMEILNLDQIDQTIIGVARK